MIRSETIFAPATPSGRGALSVIRISGEDALRVMQKCAPKVSLSQKKSHTLHYAYIRDGEEIIDEVMLALFLAPRSFTGENSVEITCHGSPFVVSRILEILIKNGARMAKPGEFTMRAFMNGRIDLAQAEAVADMISADNESSRKAAMNQLKGGISNEISLLRQDLLKFISLIELELDFSEEDVEFADRTALKILLDRIEKKLKPLIESFRYGNALKEGTSVVLAGSPNAGKSTLLNALVQDERAIVSSTAGTTRDTIEEPLNIDGHLFRLVDTAGLRSTEDEIEAVGVERAIKKISEAEVLIYLLDPETANLDEEIHALQSLLREDLFTIICLTKSDIRILKRENVQIALQKSLADSFHLIEISAKKNIGLDLLISFLKNYRDNLKSAESSTLITNRRHYEALFNSLHSVRTVKKSIQDKVFTEILSYELRRALEYLGEISGEFTSDEVLGNIFSKFCIGK